MQIEKRNRVLYIDLYKGIGILLMIAAHIGFGFAFDHYVHAFHMPLFFFISGFLFKDKKGYLISKSRSLLMPYFVYAISTYIIWKIIFNQPSDSLIHILLYMNSTDFISDALWFLTALFISNFIYWIIRSLFSNEIFITIIIAIIAIFGNMIHVIYSKPCVFSIDAGMVGTGIMHIGYGFKHYKTRLNDRLKRLSWKEIGVAMLLISALVFFNNSVNMREGFYGNVLLFWINSTIMIILIWNISNKAIQSTLHNCRGFSDIIIEILSNIGKRSLVFLCLNQVVIYLCFNTFPVNNTSMLMKLFHNAIMLAIVLIILYIIAYFKESLLKMVRRI